MECNHIKDQFLAWSEETLDPRRRSEVESHLTSCRRCSVYFETCSHIIDPKWREELPRLEADPFLPTRIAALVDERSTSGLRGPIVAGVRFSLAVMMLMIAIGFGIYLGQGPAPARQQQSDDAYFSAYYEAVSQQGFASNLDYLVETTGGRQR
ncbi:MAG TPA: hypothetical protein DCP63_03500 [Bacteroidetes bacterium]|nr:hypothetical protein [Bacteroidota bacterium]